MMTPLIQRSMVNDHPLVNAQFAVEPKLDSNLYHMWLGAINIFDNIWKNVGCKYDKVSIGDHVCDPEIAGLEACCFDKGDCIILDISPTLGIYKRFEVAN